LPFIILYLKGKAIYGDQKWHCLHPLLAYMYPVGQSAWRHIAVCMLYVDNKNTDRIPFVSLLKVFSDEL